MTNDAVFDGDAGNRSYPASFMQRKLLSRRIGQRTWIHYKTKEEMASINETISTNAKVEIDKMDQTLKEIIEIIQKDYMCVPLTKKMIKDIENLKTEKYSYSVILKACKHYRNDLLCVNSKNFSSYSLKMKYLLAILENKLPDAYKRIEYENMANRELERIAANSYSSYDSTNASNYKPRPIKTYDYKGLLDDIT